MNKSLNTKEVAALFGITARRVQQLSKPDDESPIFIRDANGDFDVYQVVPAYLNYKEDSGPKAEKLAHENEILKFKAKAAERHDKIRESELLYTKDVKKVWSGSLREIKQRCNEYLKECMDWADLKPMEREKKQNEFADFFNSLAKRDY